jgi:hypothetical protein
MRALIWLALLAAVVTDIGAADSQPLPRVIDGPDGGPVAPPRDPQTGQPAQPLPRVIDGPRSPVIGQPPAEAPQSSDEAVPRVQTGGRCEAFVLLRFGRRAIVCPLPEARAVGASCDCPYPPPPNGLLPSPPAVGRVVA